MKKLLGKYGFYLLVIIVFLGVPIYYRLTHKTIISEADKNNSIKTNVTVWMVEQSDTETRKYQVEKFNNEHKDIYIKLITYPKEDYYNLLRTSLANSDKPQIFQYGFYELFKNDQLLDLRKLGIDIDSVGKDNFLYYKNAPLGVKTAVNNVKFVWNKDILKGAGLDSEHMPETWEDVIKAGEKIKSVYPDVIPFEYPSYKLSDLRISVGEPSVNKGTIYTNFWDYKNGVYNFDYAKDILTVYNKMYAKDLTDKRDKYFEKNGFDIRKDFAAKKTAMIISTYEDKNYFNSITPLDFEIGISDLPVFNSTDSRNYYNTQNFNCLVVNKSVNDMTSEDPNRDKVKEKEAVKAVYQWFLSPDVNKELLSTKKVLPYNVWNLPVKNDVYTGYNDLKNFRNEISDPTVFVNVEEDKVINLYKAAIDGEKSVDAVITELNKDYKNYCNISKDQGFFNPNDFLEK